MIESGEVGAVFTVVDQATSALLKIANELRNVDKLIVDAKAGFSELGRTQFSGLQGRLVQLAAGVENVGKAATDAALDVLAISTAGDKALASLTASTDAMRLTFEGVATAAEASAAAMTTAFTDAATQIRADIAALGGQMRMLSLPSGGGGGGGSGGGALRRRGGGGHGGGLHWSRMSQEMPGGAHFSLPGGPAMAAAAAAGYGLYLESEFEDQAARMLLTGQVNTPQGMTNDARFKLIRDTLQRISSSTGFSPKQSGEAMLTVERQFGGLPFEKRVQIEETLAPFAASEARLKETGFAESFEALVGLAHMTGTYDPKKLPELARAFSYSSLITPSSITQLQTSLSYSMPMLHSGLDMDPASITFLTAMAQTAGIKNTKSGTWIRSFFENAEPSVGSSETAKHHNAALAKMGLIGPDGKPNWRIDGADGKVDWDKSITSMSEKIGEFIKNTPVDQRLGILKQAFGERGGGFASLMNLDEFIKQFPVLQEKMRAFKGGDDALDYLNENSPVAKFRKAWADTQLLLMDIGQTALPPVITFLKDLDDGLKKSKDEFDKFVNALTWFAEKLEHIADWIKSHLKIEIGPFTPSAIIPPALRRDAEHGYEGLKQGFKAITPAPQAGPNAPLSEQYPQLFSPMSFSPDGDDFHALIHKASFGTSDTDGVAHSKGYSGIIAAGTEQGTLEGLIAASENAKAIVAAWFKGDDGSAPISNASYSPGGGGGGYGGADEGVPGFAGGGRAPKGGGPGFGSSLPMGPAFGAVARGPSSSPSAGFGSSLPALVGSNGAKGLGKAAWLTAQLQKDYGLTREQALGAVGVMGYESGNFSVMQEKGHSGWGSGWGWAQWTGPRRRAFMAWAQDHHLDPASDEANYGFLQHELATNYRHVIPALKQTHDPRAAAYSWERNFEGMREGGPGIPAFRQHMDRASYYDRMLPQEPTRYAAPPKPLNKPTEHITNIHLDGKVVARSTSRHLAALNTHPRQAPYSDPGKGYVSPDYGFATT